MSRQSDAKKARRKKRQAGRDARWIPEQAMDALLGDEFADEPDELEQAVETFDEWLTLRGWTFDTDFTGAGLASWYFGASAAEFDDERLEPVTRVWFKLAGGDDDFPNAVSAVLVGTGEDSGATYMVTPEVLLEHIDAIEAYRDGDAAPVLG